VNNSDIGSETIPLVPLQSDRWHWASIVIHWTTVLAVLGLFILGLWMVGLTYYSEWYRTGPNIHKSIGILLFILTLIRIAWLRLKGKPAPVANSSQRDQKIAKIAHAILYVLLFAVMIFGYLISTADGRAIEVFEIFQVPAVISGIDKQEDVAGEVHFWLAIILITMVSLHALAALKHHFINKDRTLKRMLGL